MPANVVGQFHGLQDTQCPELGAQIAQLIVEDRLWVETSGVMGAREAWGHRLWGPVDLLGRSGPSMSGHEFEGQEGQATLLDSSLQSLAAVLSLDLPGSSQRERKAVLDVDTDPDTALYTVDLRLGRYLERNVNYPDHCSLLRDWRHDLIYLIVISP